MKLVSFRSHGEESWGLVEHDEIRNLGALTRAGNRSLGAVLRAGDLESVVARADDAELVPRAAVESLPPVTDAQKILCVGLNYADHIREMGRPWPEKPVVFTRFNDSLVGDGSPLVAPSNSAMFDYEGELAVVIGKAGRRISAEDALSHVLGYSIMNDGSLRDYQHHTHQFTPGKNFPRSGGFGPAIVTVDEFGEIGARGIATRVNGTVLQESTLDQLVFSVADLVAYCSEWTVLNPGDVIATGTPGGVGDGREPPIWLTPGDVVEVEIEGLGTLTNPVVGEDRRLQERNAS